MSENINYVSGDMVKLLIKKALEAREYSYSPYSRFMVGAALLVNTGTENSLSGHPDGFYDTENRIDDNHIIFTGCNIENAAYSPGNCAERTAVFKAISEGYTTFEAIAIVGGNEGGITDYTSPCGMCRQVLREFVKPENFLVIIARNEDDYIVKTLEELFPMSFGPDNLGL